MWRTAAEGHCQLSATEAHRTLQCSWRCCRSSSPATSTTLPGAVMRLGSGRVSTVNSGRTTRRLCSCSSFPFPTSFALLSRLRLLSAVINLQQRTHLICTSSADHLHIICTSSAHHLHIICTSSAHHLFSSPVCCSLHSALAPSPHNPQQHWQPRRASRIHELLHPTSSSAGRHYHPARLGADAVTGPASSFAPLVP